MSNEQQSLKIMRKPEVLSLLCVSETSLYRQINGKTFPPSFSLGCRAVGWYEHEINAVIKARAAGKTEAEIKALVNNLISARIEAA
ncbi:MAG TPA: transcriptional regulator [Alteromonas sp.]|nr:transcriptional regulator [Alteromonas sp.]HCB16553.1 transcriptional regulator [Alteromonas sp.]|tara:strand:- start:7336 stop:7593 length:258 start_codon:yes stop_codon:yes gene_type:complete